MIPSCLRVVARAAFAPRGGRYDARPIQRWPVRALRGGADGLAVGMALRGGEVEIVVFARGACSDDDAARTVEIGRGLAGVDDDPSGFVASVRRHPVLGPLVRRHDPRMTRTPTLFESLTEAILEQLVTVAEARAAMRRLWRLAGELIPGTSLRAAPTSGRIRDVPMWTLRAIGVGARRAVTLHACARRGAAIERLRELSPEVAMEKLESLRGIGPWTSNRVARAALGFADAVPVGDLHAPRLVTEALTGTPGDDEAMLAALEPLRPHRARVVKLLEESLVRAGPLPRVDRHRRRPWAF